MPSPLVKFHARLISWRSLVSEEAFAVLVVVFILVMPAAAATRFQERGLFMQSSEPGVTTTYTLSFDFMSPDAVGSVDMLFCNSPIPYDPCVVPTGLDVSNTVLSSQTGETGFAISTKTPNHIILSRSPTPITTSGTKSTYVFTGIKNPIDTSQAFAIRLKSLGSSDGSGPQIDFGSVRGSVNTGIMLQTQVPPMLIFCLAQTVEQNCTGTDDTYYTDMGTLSPNSTLQAQSQMAVGTNASGGFVITANGSTLAAGTNVITPLATSTFSEPGKNQFGINLVANNSPTVGSDPDGPFTNAVAAPGYDTPNKYKYVNGDVVAYSPNVSLMRRFTVSYIVNSAANLRAGVYSTTINFIASGRF